MSTECPQSYFWVGDRSSTVDADFYKSLKQVSPELYTMIKRAVGIANRHGLGANLKLTDPDNLSSMTTTFISKIDDSLPVDEAMILAVEMYDIFHNNPRIMQLKAELSYGRKVFVSTTVASSEADVAIIVLNRKGEYLTSYDNSRGEFFPVNLKITKKQKELLDACLADNLSRLYGEVRENISKVREEIDRESSEC